MVRYFGRLQLLREGGGAPASSSHFYVVLVISSPRSSEGVKLGRAHL